MCKPFGIELSLSASLVAVTPAPCAVPCGTSLGGCPWPLCLSKKKKTPTSDLAPDGVCHLLGPSSLAKNVTQIGFAIVGAPPTSEALDYIGGLAKKQQRRYSSPYIK